MNNGIKRFEKIESGKMKLEEAKNAFKSNLNEISKGGLKSKEQESALDNIKLLYELPEAVVKLFNDYSSILSEAKYQLIHGEGLKILTPRHMPQRLAIALAQEKAVHTSENLLNNIIETIYSLYWEKEITTKVYNILMNSSIQHPHELWVK